MCQLNINIPEEVLFDTRMSKEQANDYIRKLVALDFYSHNGVSIGYCAQIAGMCEEEFCKFLGSHNISVFNFSSKEDFEEELANA